MKQVVPEKTIYMRRKKGLMSRLKALIRGLDPAKRTLGVDARKRRGELGGMALVGAAARHGTGLG